MTLRELLKEEIMLNMVTWDGKQATVPSGCLKEWQEEQRQLKAEAEKQSTEGT